MASSWGFWALLGMHFPRLARKGNGSNQEIYLNYICGGIRTPRRPAPISHAVVSVRGCSRTGAIRAAEPLKTRNLGVAQPHLHARFTDVKRIVYKIRVFLPLALDAAELV
jgi:hypothetical protein